MPKVLRDYLVVGAVIIATSAGVALWKLSNDISDPLIAPAITETSTSRVLLETIRFSAWTPSFMHVEDNVVGATGETVRATRLTEDASDSYRNITIIMNGDRSKYISFTVTAKPMQGRVMRIFLFSGNDRIICDVDTISNKTAVIALGMGKVSSCELQQGENEWAKVQLIGRISPTGGEMGNTRQ